jgi:death-on-curing protein
VSDWLWLDERDALAVHEQSLVLHGGAPGLRDEGLLQSALARARQIEAYDEAAGVVELAVAYTAGIVRNHPFIDGNKRTGFVLGVLFLELNGVRFTASEEAATRAVLDLAAGTIDDEGYAAFLRENIVRP